MFLRIPLGLIKGGIVGGILGAGLWALFRFGAPTFFEYLLYGVVGAFAGIVCGQPPWRKGAWVASILKGIVGFGIGIGLYVLASKFFDPVIPIAAFAPGRQNLTAEYFVFGPVVGAIYGILVEIDDGGKEKKKEKPAAEPKKQ